MHACTVHGIVGRLLSFMVVFVSDACVWGQAHTDIFAMCRKEEVINKFVKNENQTASLDAKLTAREARQIACGRVYEALVANENVKSRSCLITHLLTKMQQELGSGIMRVLVKDMRMRSFDREKGSSNCANPSETHKARM
jgi:hypothetical protein